MPPTLKLDQKPDKITAKEERDKIVVKEESVKVAKTKQIEILQEDRKQVMKQVQMDDG